MRADEKNCNRIGVFFQLAIVERPSASNDRPFGRGEFFLSFLPPLPPSLSLQISWPTAKNQSARFFPLVSSTTIVDSILSLSLSLFARFVKIRRPSIRVPRGELSQLRLVAISARNVFLDNEFPSIDPFYFP